MSWNFCPLCGQRLRNRRCSLHGPVEDFRLYGECICPPYTSEEDATWHRGDCPADPNSRIPRRRT